MGQTDFGSILDVRTIDSLELGITKNGTPFATGRSLAKLCGVAASTIIERKNEWEQGDRDGKLLRMVAATGYTDDALAFPVKHPGVGVGAEALAYPEPVVMAFLEYYAFEVKRPEAVQNFRVFGRAGFKLFVYTQLGFGNKAAPDPWRQFHARLQMHALPSGYFSCFREMSDLVLTAIQRGMPMDERTVPDISVGIAWAKHWEKQLLDEKYGLRKKHEHNYPADFSQSASNPQQMNVYPIDALGEFRRWMDTEYLPNKFPKYIRSKVSDGLLASSAAELLIAAVAPSLLPAPK